MTASNLLQEMKRHALLMAPVINHRDLEIAKFLRGVRCLVFNVRNRDISSMAKGKNHSEQSDILKVSTFI